MVIHVFWELCAWIDTRRIPGGRDNGIENLQSRALFVDWFAPSEEATFFSMMEDTVSLPIFARTGAAALLVSSKTYPVTVSRLWITRIEEEGRSTLSWSFDFLSWCINNQLKSINPTRSRGPKPRTFSMDRRIRFCICLFFYEHVPNAVHDDHSDKRNLIHKNQFCWPGYTSMLRGKISD